MRRRPPARVLGTALVLGAALTPRAGVAEEAREAAESPVEHESAGRPAGDIGAGESAPSQGAARGSVAFTIEVDAASQIVATDNADLAETREATQDDIDETDDRATFGSAALAVDAALSPADAATLNAGVVVFGAYGDSAGSAAVELAEANATLRLAGGGEAQWTLTLGRQDFAIGGVPHDYVLDGLVDGVTTEISFGRGLALRGLLFDLFGANEPLDATYRYSRPGRDRPSGQRGETNTYRSGAVLQAVDPFAVDGLDARAFVFFTTIGGSYVDGTGSDISRGGLIGNFRDRDYVHVFGGRAAYRADLADRVWLRPYVDFARSTGLDRKEVNAVDVVLDGNAIGLGIELEAEQGSFGAHAVADWHRFDGAKYSVSGLEYHRGFVSLMGDRIGGVASGRLASWRPSATLEADGVLHAPDDVARAAGTDTTQVQLELSYAATSLGVGFWTYTDTRASAFDQSTLSYVDPPYGYSREEFAALARAGRKLGNELEVSLQQSIAARRGSIFVTGGLFLPGAYYDVPIARVATPRADEGFARLGGAPASFWVLMAGADLALIAERVR